MKKAMLGFTVLLLSITGKTAALKAETVTTGIEIKQKVVKVTPLEIVTTVNIKVTAQKHLDSVSFRYFHNTRDEQYGNITINVGYSGGALKSIMLYQPKTLTINGVVLRPSKIAEDGKSFQDQESSSTKYRYALIQGDPIDHKEERLMGKVTRSKGGPFVFHQEGQQSRTWVCTPLHKETDPP